MAIKAFVALSIALANPAWAGEEIGTGDSGTWSFAPDQALPPDVGSEQPVALARFASPDFNFEADVGAERIMLTGRTLSGQDVPTVGTVLARTAANRPNRG